MTLDSPKFSLLLFLLNITIGVGAQNIHNLPSKWNDWSQHPKHSFYKIESDTTASPDGVVLRTRGDWNGIFGTSYPMFNKGKKSLEGEVKIKYKVERCKKLLLTLHSIGKNASLCLPTLYRSQPATSPLSTTPFKVQNTPTLPLLLSSTKIPTQ